jgi:hypothetical protein
MLQFEPNPSTYFVTDFSSSGQFILCLYTRKCDAFSQIMRFYTRKNLTSRSKSANKPSTSCVCTACPNFGTS